MRHQDGLFDIYFGVLILAIAASSLVEWLGASSSWRLATLIGLQFGGAALFALAKRRYATPRQGTVRFGAKRVQRTCTLRVALAVCVLLTALLVVSTALGRSPLSWLAGLGAYALPTAIAFVVGLPLMAIAYFLEFPRILVHAILFFATGFALTAAGHNFMSPLPGAIAFGISGSISVAIGLFYFTRFLRQTSVPTAEGDPHDS